MLMMEPDPILSKATTQQPQQTGRLPPLDLLSSNAIPHLEHRDTARTTTPPNPSSFTAQEGEGPTMKEEADAFLSIPARSFFANGVDLWIQIMQYLPEKIAVRVVGSVNCAAFRASLDETVRLSFFRSPVTFNDASLQDLRHARSAVLLAGADNDCPSLRPKVEGETYLEKDRFAQFLGLNNYRQVLSYEDRNSLMSGVARAAGDVTLASLPQKSSSEVSKSSSSPDVPLPTVASSSLTLENTTTVASSSSLEDASLVTRHVPSTTLSIENQKPVTLIRGKKYSGPLKAGVSSIQNTSKCGRFAVLKTTTGETFVLNTVTGTVQCTFNEQFSFHCFEWIPAEQLLLSHGSPSSQTSDNKSSPSRTHAGSENREGENENVLLSPCCVGLVTISTAEGEKEGCASTADTILIQLWKIPVNPTAGAPEEVWSTRVRTPRVFLKHCAGSSVRLMVPPPSSPHRCCGGDRKPYPPSSSLPSSVWVLEGATRWMFLSLNDGTILQDLDAPYSYEDSTLLGAEFLDSDGRFAAMWGSRKFILYDLQKKKCLEFTPNCPKSSWGWATARLSAVSYSRTGQTLSAVAIESQEGSAMICTFKIVLPSADPESKNISTSAAAENEDRPLTTNSSSSTSDSSAESKMEITQLPFYKIPKKLLSHEEEKHLSWSGKVAKILPLSFGFAFFFPPPEKEGIQLWPGEDPTSSSSLYIVPVNLVTSEIVTAASCNTSNWIEEQLPLRNRGGGGKNKKNIVVSSSAISGTTKVDPLSKDDPKIAVVRLPPNSDLGLGCHSSSSLSGSGLLPPTPSSSSYSSSPPPVRLDHHILDVIASPGGHSLQVLTQSRGPPSDQYIKKYHSSGSTSSLVPKSVSSRRIVCIKLFSESITSGGKRILPPLSLKRGGKSMLNGKKLSSSSSAASGLGGASEDGASSVVSGGGLSSARTASSRGTSLKSLKSRSTTTTSKSSTGTIAATTAAAGLIPTAPGSKRVSRASSIKRK